MKPMIHFPKNNLRGKADPKVMTALITALLLSACVNSDNGSDPEYDKYKNTPVNESTAKASLQAQSASMAAWDGMMENPVSVSDVPGTGSGAEWMMVQKAAGPAKVSAGDDLVIDSSTAAQGYATFSITRAGLLSTTYDTAVVKWDAQARDGISGNENVMSWSHTVAWVNGTRERAAFTDADGDGLVNVVPGGQNRVRIDYRKEWNGGSPVETAVVVAAAGPDGSFDGEADNRLYQAEWERRIGGKLAASAQFTDEDGDGLVLDNADTSVIRLTAWESMPTLRPLVKGVRAVVRVRKLGYGKGEEPVGFEYTDTLRDGRNRHVYLRNSAGGDVILANDTLRLFAETRQKDGNDSLRSLDVKLAFGAGADLKSQDDDVFYSLRVEAHNRLGFQRDMTFEVVSATPVPRGQAPQSGTFRFDATYANRKSVSVVGTFTPTAFQGTYTGPKGDTASFYVAR
jgi:hypothetical protein